jgi:hypothetical protein
VEVLAEEEEEATEDEGSPDTEAEATGGELWSQSARNTFTISSPGIVRKVSFIFEEGWFPSSFGHVEDYSPSSLAYYQDHLLLNQLYSHLSPQQCQEEALRLYHDFLATEQSYQTSLQFFIANFIQTFSLRDSSFKRSFLNEYSIALSFTLIQEIYKSSAQLLSIFPSPSCLH